MQINERLVKISRGKIPIDKELEMGDDLELNLRGTVVKVEDTDNNDGTINRTYIVRCMGVDTTNISCDHPVSRIM